MYKYKNKCAFRLLIYFEGELINVRPNEIIRSKTEINIPYLVRVQSPISQYIEKKKVTNGRLKSKGSTTSSV